MSAFVSAAVSLCVGVLNCLETTSSVDFSIRPSCTACGHGDSPSCPRLIVCEVPTLHRGRTRSCLLRMKTRPMLAMRLLVGVVPRGWIMRDSAVFAGWEPGNPAQTQRTPRTANPGDGQICVKSPDHPYYFHFPSSFFWEETRCMPSA